MTHVMIDLETMGTRASSAIIAIGLVAFTETEIMDKLYIRVSLDSNIRTGRTLDATTIIWWLQQSDAARAEFTDQSACIALVDALDRVDAFMRRSKLDCVWGNGSDFDCAMLSDAFRQLLQQDPPWPFYANRDLRTLRMLSPDTPRIPFSEGVKHNALADAENQALHVQAILRDLEEKGVTI